MNLQDRRALRTKKLMAEALIKLSTQKSYDEITIRDIVDQADIAYSTFFQHYHDKDALLRDIASETINQFIELLGSIPNCTPYDVGLQIFNQVIEHEAVFRIFLIDSGVNRILREAKENLLKIIVINKEMANYTQLPSEIIINHIVSSILSLIRWWLDHDKPCSVEQMALVYDKLIIRSVYLALSEPDSNDHSTLPTWLSKTVETVNL
jgi:AcrR family transcriptional regulator